MTRKGYLYLSYFWLYPHILSKVIYLNWNIETRFYFHLRLFSQSFVLPRTSLDESVYITELECTVSPFRNYCRKKAIKIRSTLFLVLLFTFILFSQSYYCYYLEPVSICDSLYAYCVNKSFFFNWLLIVERVLILLLGPLVSQQYHLIAPIELMSPIFEVKIYLHSIIHAIFSEYIFQIFKLIKSCYKTIKENALNPIHSTFWACFFIKR